MNVTSFITKDYENESTFRVRENKPKQTRSEFIPKGAEIPTGELPGILKPGTNFKGCIISKSMNIEVADPAFRGRNQSSIEPFVVSLGPVSRESISIRKNFAASKSAIVILLSISVPLKNKEREIK